MSIRPDLPQFISDYTLDYKTKSLKLMKQLAESELQARKNQEQAEQFRVEAQAYHSQLKEFVRILGASSVDEAYIIARKVGQSVVGE